MIILTIRTDKPEAEIGIYSDDKQLAYDVWTAHRALAETLHKRIQIILNKLSLNLDDLDGIVVYKGPGSFTGLRIGISLANALAYSKSIQIIGIEGEKDWIEKGLALLSGEVNHINVTPVYGEAVRITKQKK